MKFTRKSKVILFTVTAAIAATAYFLLAGTSPNIIAQNIPETIDFNYHIRPILSDRCFKCHGPDANKREAELRLDTEEGAFKALKDNPAGHVIIPGNPLQSELYLRVSSKDTSYLMPPPSSNLKLSDFEIKLIEKWIRQGAKFKKHWAFIAPQLPQLPKVDDKKWVKNEIDYFILSKLESYGLSPNEEADKERLLKRASLDITGLPPPVEMQDKFLKDDSPDAYEKMVDELLANPHYGEKMAIYWMDVARYADSHGYQDDGLRTMWPWRDWVIHAFNKNYPYDQFITWQLAGDLLQSPSKEQLLASGFNRNHKITQEGGVIDEEYRIEYVTDRTNTFGKAFLALTFECAKCHDHKYDPIAQKDYYSTFAFFNQVNEKGLVGDITLASPGDPPNMKITTEDVKNVLQFINKKDTAPVVVMVMQDSSKLRTTRVLKRGNYDAPTDTVSFNLPRTIMPYDTNVYGKNRLGLAKWLTDKKHPLTARVFVNRIWQEIFGRGLVKTSGDFGMQGELPSHPELLDWLAVDFMNNGWNIKRLVKQIMMSATYRQSSEVSKEKINADPENIYLSHSPRLRLTAELTRDLVLESSGLLVKEIGGPSVKPYQPKGVWESTTSGRGELQKYFQDHGDSLYRRGLYTFIKRTAPPPVMLVFDASNRDQCEVKRLRTNTPLQALVLLNDPQVLEASRVLAQKMIPEKISDKEKIEKIFRLIVCRKPKSKELKLLTEYLREEKEKYSKEPAKAHAFIKAGEYKIPEGINKVDCAALMQVIHTIYNLEESTTKS
jgi:hypothetical protein